MCARIWLFEVGVGAYVMVVDTDVAVVGGVDIVGVCVGVVVGVGCGGVLVVLGGIDASAVG